MASSRRDIRPATDAPQGRGFFGHPRGLATLFFSEMWERFSYYGMRGFLILYMTAAASAGGMGLSTAAAAGIYGTYTSLVYLMSLPGGWIADRVIGQRRAVLVGGILIAAGHFSLAVPASATFFIGLGLIVLGTGLLKPNISVIVGELYAPDDVRRDAAFSIFYMGINVGGFFGPIVTGWLAQSMSFRSQLAAWGLDPNSAWHWGFAAAGIGMTLGLAQYVLGARWLGTAGLQPAAVGSPAEQARLRRTTLIWSTLGLAVLVALVAGVAGGVLPVTVGQITGAYGYVLLAATIAVFAALFGAGQWTRTERRHLYLIGVFFLAAALFWSVFEQAGSTLSLFADRSTRNSVFGRSFPSSWWQSLNALLIFILAPCFAWLWVRLGNRQPSSPTKFSLGLLGVGASFLVLIPAASAAAGGARVGPHWLLMTYLLQTLGELCLSPVGLSSMTRLAPARIVSLMMGVWFLAASVGNFLGGQAASFYESMPLARLLGSVAVLPIAAGVLMWLARRPLTTLISGAPGAAR